MTLKVFLAVLIWYPDDYSIILFYCRNRQFKVTGGSIRNKMAISERCKTETWLRQITKSCSECGIVWNLYNSGL